MAVVQIEVDKKMMMTHNIVKNYNITSSVTLLFPWPVQPMIAYDDCRENGLRMSPPIFLRPNKSLISILSHLPLTARSTSLLYRKELRC
jgi:hypothetical protein